MNDVDERLRASDPVAGQSYEHRDANAMMARIIAQNPVARSTTWRNFRLRMAGAVTLASVVTIGGIAAINGAAPSFAVLSIGATAHTKAAVPAAGIMGTMRVLANYDFSAGSGLGATPSSASYQLTVPASASSEASRLAAIFSVSGSPVDVNGDGSDWSVGTSGSATLDYQSNGGVPQWYYTNNELPSTATSSTTSDSTSSAVPSQSALEAEAQTYLAQLGYGYQVSDPQFSTSSISDTNTGVTSNQETVSYTIDVGGLATDQSVQFTVDSNDVLVDASGPAFSVASSTPYPLVTPQDGVTQLNAQQQSQMQNYASQSSGSTSGAAAGSPGNPATTTTTIPTLNVTLDAVSVALQTYALTDGSVWLLPVYDYSGAITNADGSSTSGDWYLLAVDPAYVHVAQSNNGPLRF